MFFWVDEFTSSKDQATIKTIINSSKVIKVTTYMANWAHEVGAGCKIILEDDKSAFVKQSKKEIYLLLKGGAEQSVNTLFGDNK